MSNGNGTSISGFPIYAQGPGIAYTGGRADWNSGFYVVVRYDNGYVARYLHVEQSGRVANGSRVSHTTMLAYTSNTGTPDGGGTYGHHLHYDVIHHNHAGNNFQNLGQGNINNINPRSLFPIGTFSN